MNKDNSKEHLLEMVSENIKFLANLDNNSYDSWGDRFGFNRGQISTYVTKKAQFPVINAIEVCGHYGIKMADFYSRKLEASDIHRDESNINSVSEPIVDYSTTPDFTEGLRKEEATALYRQLLKEKRKVEILTETLKNI